MEITQEMFEKAKGAKSPQELLELAKAEGIELTEEAAKEIFAKLHPESGELSDEEMEKIAGGMADAEWWKVPNSVKNWKEQEK